MIDLPKEQGTLGYSGSSKKKVVIGGCIGCAAVCVLVCIVVVILIVMAGGQPEGVKLSLLSPATVKIDEVFELTISVKNERPRKEFKVKNIDIYDSYLSGFVVVSNSPEHESSEHIPILDCSSYTFDVSIKPGETKAFTFKLRAVEPGVHRGDIEVHEGMRAIKKLAQTHVK